MKKIFVLISLFFYTSIVFAELLEVTTYDTDRPVGSIIVDTNERKLYYLVDYKLAYVYPVAVGKKRYQFFGKYEITRKAKWPIWRPTESTLADKPWLPSVVDGGKDNPLGARALYLGDSDYRIHGTNNPKSIGKAASRGCIRMYNEDAIELYSMVDKGSFVYVE
jgi:lipoprotein-anchoring transpeptidase ErfK/SrfK